MEGMNKNTIFNYIDRIKNEDNGYVQFLKLCYSIGKISWIHAVISVTAGILIPILYDSKKYWYMGFAIIITFLDIVFSYICDKYQNKLYMERKFTAELLDEYSSLIKSLSIFVESEPNWKNKIYKTTSAMVCDRIYRIFKEDFKCETRVSVEYIFDKTVRTEKRETYVKMAGRMSKYRSVPKKSIPLEHKNKYFSYQIFTNNNVGMNILSEEQIESPKIWYKNPKNNVEVKKYIGIAVSVFDDQIVNYILQIDFLNEFKFGENDSEEDIKKFVDQYLLPYVNVIGLSYLLNLNSKREIIEV